MKTIIVGLFVSATSLLSANLLRVERVDPTFRARMQTPRPNDRIKSPGPDLLALVTFNYAIGVSDLTWLQTVQTIGEGTTIDDTNWSRIEDLAQITTDLDPRYLIAYDSSAVVLSAHGGRVDASDALLLKGRSALPDEYRFPCMLGYNAFFMRDDAVAGSQWYGECASKPDAPRYAASLAGRMLSAAGDSAGAMTLLEELIPQLTGEVRADAEWRLKALTSEAVFEVYDEACALYRLRNGSMPSTTELHERGWAAPPPFDSFGDPIVFDDACRASTASIPNRSTNMKRGGSAPGLQYR